MALINHAKKEINAKIVFYGPSGCGKKTALNYIYSRIKPSLRGDLRAVPAGSDSLLFFDFSPFDAPLPSGYRLRLHIYTLTGDVTNPATWKMTLKGTDGIIIMVNPDSRCIDENINSVNQLRDFLSAYGAGIHETPTALLLNRLTPAASPDKASQVQSALDLGDIITCSSMATSGEGLLEALSALSRQVIERITPPLDHLKEQTTTGTNEAPVADKFQTPVPTQEKSPPPAAMNGETPPETGQSSSRPVINLLNHQCDLEGTSLKIPLEIICGETRNRVVISVSVTLE